MWSLGKVYILLWLSVFHIQNAVSGPMEISNRYQKASAIEQNDWRLVLASIESRLKSLDFLYTSQLTPTLETRMEHFQNRISGMEVKLQRVEVLLTSKLDRMSDNISSRLFRDDMVQTDIFRKMETAYDGLTHRLAYMDRKSENSFIKLVEKYEGFSKKLDALNNALTEKYDSIESQLSDIVDGVEDIGEAVHNKRMNYSGLYSNKTLEMQDGSRGYPSEGVLNEVKVICKNSSDNSKKIEAEMHNFTLFNSMGDKLNSFSEYLGNMLNEYASKVSDLGAQVTKADTKIATHLSTIEKVVNSSKSEMQNSLRVLMVQLGKLSPKDNAYNEVIEPKLLSDVAQKLDSNFETVISLQNTFLENCHRLQMDESQLEGQISDILNKLIDNFEGTTQEQHLILGKIEAMLVQHNLHTKKELHKANTNIKTLHEQYKKESKETKERYLKTSDELDALLVLVQNILGGGSSVTERGIPKQKELVEYIQSLEKSLNSTKLEQMKMFDSVEMLLTLSQSRQEDEHSNVDMMRNLTENIHSIKQHFEYLPKNSNVILDIPDSARRTYETIEKNVENLRNLSVIDEVKQNTSKGSEIPGNSNTTESSDRRDIDDLIKQIFSNNGNVTTTPNTSTACLDIDIRFDDGGDTSNNEYQRRCQNASDSDDKIIFSSEENAKDGIDCLEIPINPRFSQDEIVNRKKLCGSKNATTEKQNSGEELIERSTTVKDQLLQNIIPFLEITDNRSHVDINVQ